MVFFFTAINFPVLSTECQLAKINFRVSLSCLFRYNGSFKFSLQFNFAKNIFLANTVINTHEIR